jgi:hypothetical protein
MALFHFDQQVDLVLDFLEVLEAVLGGLVAPTGDALDDAALEEVQVVGGDVLHRLDLLALVVAAGHLDGERAVLDGVDGLDHVLLAPHLVSAVGAAAVAT